MNKKEINELREKLNNITNEQLADIADILYDKVVDDEQYIIDAWKEFFDRAMYSGKENKFGQKTKNPDSIIFYAGFKVAEKMYK